MTGFPGFPQDAIDFFRGLARHNRREWFQPRKPVFEAQVKQPMHELVESVNAALRRFAPDYATDPARAVYRIYRDTRFSKDKTPYKTHIAASFRHRELGGEGGGAGYYFAVSHKEVAVGGGVYMPAPATLLAIRGHIAENHHELRKILSAKSVRTLLGGVQGEQLTRVPKGFCTGHPAADLLRYKQIFLYVKLSPELAITPQLLKEIVSRFQAMTPFLEFLNAPLPRRRAKVDARELLI